MRRINELSEIDEQANTPGDNISSNQQPTNVRFSKFTCNSILIQKVVICVKICLHGDFRTKKQNGQGLSKSALIVTRGHQAQQVIAIIEKHQRYS